MSRDAKLREHIADLQELVVIQGRTIDVLDVRIRNLRKSLRRQKTVARLLRLALRDQVDIAGRISSRMLRMASEATLN